MEGKKLMFVASMWVLALCGLVAGGLALYEHVDVRLNGQAATMELAYPDKKIVEYGDSLNMRVLDVRYVDESGDIVVPNKILDNAIADRLIAGEKIPVTYMTNNTKRVLYSNYRGPNPWPWLIVGLVALATAIYATRLFKRETGRE